MHKTIGKEALFELVERKSRFIAHVRPVATEEEAIAFVEEIRAEHAQARHNVYAYRLACGRTRYTDDGEPSQTAGMPTLQVLDHAGVVDAACVTTRYFGGTLLGTGGLVRAYTQAAQGALEAAGIVVMEDCRDVGLVLDYSLYEQVQRFVEAFGARIEDAAFTDRVALSIRVRADEADELARSLRELTCGRCDPSIGEPFQALL